MRLIGMLDSPYVRRVAVSMKVMGLHFAHEPLSVFRDFEAFAAINPVVKAPTLVTEDGLVLMESTLILDHLRRQVEADRTLIPADFQHHAGVQRISGLALAACEKTVQIVYETNLRPAEKQHQPWLDRVGRQLSAAYGWLERAIGERRPWCFGARISQADIDAAVAWRFTRTILPGMIEASDHPALAALSERAEALPEFLSTPAE